MVAPGATAPATSMSSATSVSGPLGSPVGAFCAPSTDTAITLGSGIFSPEISLQVRLRVAAAELDDADGLPFSHCPRETHTL